MGIPTFQHLLILCLLSFVPRISFAESQNSEYKGITDPFGDPTTYEFAEDEKEDKEFFHLGRYIMIGLDGGVGLFTGGLGRTNDPGGYFGINLLYFFDKQIALELAVHYANHLDTIQPSASQLLQLDTSIVPMNLGFRWYFDVKDAPKAIAIANPYLAIAGGLYYRSMDEIQQKGLSLQSNGRETAPGFSGGGGLQFLIYQKHIYLGLDFRYHFIFFSDAGSSLGLDPRYGIDRSGGYFSSALSLSYNF